MVATKTATVTARIDPKVKQAVEAICAELGLSTSDAIGLMCRKFIREQQMANASVCKNTPNKATQKVLKEMKQGKNIVVNASYDAFLKELLK